MYICDHPKYINKSTIREYIQYRYFFCGSEKMLADLFGESEADNGGGDDPVKPSSNHNYASAGPKVKHIS
jgi:hypothetical protein